MKCDKFTTPVKIEIPGLGTIESEDLLLKVEVDEAIAELKQKLHDAEMQADLAECAVTEYKIDCDKLKDENRRLNRALWLARVKSAENAVTNWCSECMEKWNEVERKCRAKAEEFK